MSKSSSYPDAEYLYHFKSFLSVIQIGMRIIDIIDIKEGISMRKI